MGKDWKDELQEYKDFRHGKVDETDFEDQPYHKSKRRRTCYGNKPHEYTDVATVWSFGSTRAVTNCCVHCGKRNWGTYRVVI